MKNVFLSILLVGCTIPDPIDPGPVDATDCPTAQDHLEDLECAELLEVPGDDGVVGTADDPSWSEWCEWVQNSGIDPLDLECVLAASDCDKIEGCLDE